MANSHLTDLRDEMTVEIHKMSSEGYSSKEFVAQFRTSHPHLLERTIRDLVDIALIKIFHEVKSRKVPISSSKRQGDLFSEYDGDRIFTVPDLRTGRNINLKLPDLMCSQLQEWCARHEKEKAKVDRKVEQAKRILEKIEGHWSNDTTVREAWAAAKRSPARKLDRAR